MAFPKHGTFKFPDKPCLVCKTVFTPKSGAHKFCSEKCKGKWQYITGSGSTENQYKKISGNWGRYLSRLVKRRRRADGLTKEVLLDLLEKQKGLCALTGEAMTCLLENGTVNYTNASIDRIEPGGSYGPENIRLVCRVVNTLRLVHSDLDFINWCKKVVDHHAKTT